jgi:beta-lactamase regulating signal transducer with metallopeptidase domain
MAGIFLKLFNMSITACWIVLAVVIFRVLFKKAPKWISCLLWGAVGLRLVLPVSLKSIFSLIPSVQTVAPSTDSYGVPFEINTGIAVINSNIDEYLGSHYYEGITRPVNNFSNIVEICGQIWIIGVIALLVYGLISYIRLAKKVAPSIKKEGNVYLCDGIGSPFILGIIRPKIYLPSDMSEEQAAFVVEHEKAHLKRRDHWWKPLGFLLLSVYWFNPVMWLAYVLLCRDIEQACDEKVIKNMGVDYKKGYSHALVACSIKRFSISACPLAFGEVAVKDRIKAVLNYKKPAFWIIVVALLVGVGVAVCFLTDPKDKDNTPDMLNVIEGIGISNVEGGTDCNQVSFDVISGQVNGSNSYVEVRWKNNSEDNLCFGRQYTLYKDGEVVEPSIPLVWTLELSMVMPEGSYTEKYDLSSFSLVEGEYRIEKPFYLDSDKETEYTAYINFTVEERNLAVYRSIERYEPIEEVYCPMAVSSYREYPILLVENDEAYISEENEVGLSYVKTYLGKLQKTGILESGFAEKIDSTWDVKGIKAELKKNNRNVYYVENADKNSCYYLFEQKNGDFYMAISAIDSNTLYGIIKMRKVFIYTRVHGDEILDESLDLAKIKDRLEQLQKQYPEAFNLPTGKGLEVYVSSFAEGNYRFSVTYGTNRKKDVFELMELPSFSADEMKAILSTYDISSSDIAVIPYQAIHSSHLWFDKENDVEMLRQMLGLE